MTDDPDTPNDSTDSGDTAAADATGTDDPEADLPEAVVDRARTLTRRAIEAVDEDERRAYRDERDALLETHGYAARVREDDTDATLVLHPAEWLDGGTARVDAIEDTDRAVELSLSGGGNGDDWESVEHHNRAVAERVRAEHGDVHGATADAFADFMSNHYAKPLEAATPAEREEFRTEYFPRNAWPTVEQREAVERSLTLTLELAESG